MADIRLSQDGIKKALDSCADKDLNSTKLANILDLDNRTIEKFFQGNYLRVENFIKICNNLDLNWKEISERRQKVFNERVRQKEYLNPMLSSPYTQKLSAWIEDKTRGFVGRDYVFKAFKEFTKLHKRGYFSVIGDPGEGKSTIVAKYVLENPCAYYFNSRRPKYTSTAQFLEYTCKQLIGHYKLKLSFTVDKVKDGAFLQEVLTQISTRLQDNEKLVIVVDALDEADLTAHQKEGSIALYLPEGELPEKIYFLLTWRRDKNIKPLLPSPNYVPSKIFDLKNKKEEIDGLTKNIEEECNKDIQTYIEKYLDCVDESNELKTVINTSKSQKKEIINELVKKSKRNFMYLTLVLPEMIDGCYQSLILEEIKKGNLKELRLKSLPDSLNDYYRDHWIRMGMMSEQPPMEKIYIIYVMSENGLQTGLSMTRSLIAKYSGQKETIVQWILDNWDQFLEIDLIKDEKNPDYCPLGYAFYHETYNDFLYSQEIIQSAGIDLKMLNAEVADREMPPDVEY